MLYKTPLVPIYLLNGTLYILAAFIQFTLSTIPKMGFHKAEDNTVRGK